jgi:hypothetical protein
MPLVLYPKPSLTDFIATCTPLAVVDELEAYIQGRIDQMTEIIQAFSGAASGLQQLVSFLQYNPDSLGIILAMANFSQEKFLRVLSAQRHALGDYGSEWGVKKVQQKLVSEPVFAESVAALFFPDQMDSQLRAFIAPFYLHHLALPTDWLDQLVNTDLGKKSILRKLTGEYTDLKGDYIEAIIRARLSMVQENYGVSHEKGQVTFMGLGKEVDHAIPSREDPYVLVMSSYMETTSSSQTARANEQRTIYQHIDGHNQRYPGQSRRIFVNFVDGAGWLTRRSDLKKLHASCHYIVNLNTLDQLEAIICRFVPERYFNTTRPTVIDART